MKRKRKHSKLAIKNPEKLDSVGIIFPKECHQHIKKF